ncbi:Zinc finger protein, partial [Pseudolycoriella hygida]
MLIHVNDASMQGLTFNSIDEMTKDGEDCKQWLSSSGNKLDSVLDFVEKVFQCEVCNKKFSCNSHLQIHQRSHTGEKPFQCDKCESRFATKRSLIRHELRHKGEVPERPFSCPECGKNFTAKSVLKTHMLIHDNDPTTSTFDSP